MDPVMVKQWRLYTLEMLAQDPGALLSSTLHLFQNDITPTVNTLLADLDEADFTGYAPLDPIVWDSAFITPEGLYKLVGESTLFEMTATTVINTIYGWYVTRELATVDFLVVAKRFDAPIEVTVTGAGVLVLPEYIWGG